MMCPAINRLRLVPAYLKFLHHERRIPPRNFK